MLYVTHVIQFFLRVCTRNKNIIQNLRVCMETPTICYNFGYA
jgi:hypothetical protein